MSPQNSPDSFPLEQSTVHLLSSKSIEQGRDVFLFNHNPQPPIRLKLAAGLNSSQNNITIKTLYRWIDTIEDRGRESTFQLWKINLTRYGVLKYSAVRTGKPLPRSSTEPLQAGDYATYGDDGEPGGKPIGRLVGPTEPYPNFAERERLIKEAIIDYPDEKETLEKLLDHCSISPALSDKIKERDGGICFFTGRTPSKTRVCWLIPPLLGEQCRTDITKRITPSEADEIYEEYKAEANLIVLDEELVIPFMENKFGVDVEDNYKIVIFGPLNLPSRLQMGQNLPASAAQQNRDKFLHGNFKQCLGHQFLGGEIREDYPDNGEELLAIVDEDGLEGLEGMDSSLVREIINFYGGDISDEEDEDDSEEYDSEDGSGEESEEEGEEEERR